MSGTTRKGQVSIELIIIIAAVLAVALILVTQLQKTAAEGSEVMGKESDSALNKVATMITCEGDEDCPTGSGYACNAATGKCEK